MKQPESKTKEYFVGLVAGLIVGLLIIVVKAIVL